MAVSLTKTGIEFDEFHIWRETKQELVDDAYDVPRESVGPCECGNWFLYYKEALL